MRIKRSRLETYHCRKRVTQKDKEGSTYEEWGAAVPFSGESWPASGKVQAQQYGERLACIRNLRIEGRYTIETDEKGMVSYDFGNGLKIQESDGICLYVPGNHEPDYRIISIKPYRPLKLEVERI
ncbi:MAG: hypothetical protein Q4C91_23850 [Eubacteriales bacterium]|nr:hypothetical protein [Eubacteriales bacterium]